MDKWVLSIAWFQLFCMFENFHSKGLGEIIQNCNHKKKEAAGPTGNKLSLEGNRSLALTQELTEFKTGKGLGNPPGQINTWFYGFVKKHTQRK